MTLGYSGQSMLLDMFFTAADLARLRRTGPAVPGDRRRARIHRCGDPGRAARPDFGEDGRGLWLARELSDRLDITDGAGGAIVTLEFELVVTRRDTPGLASAAAPGGLARR